MLRGRTDRYHRLGFLIPFTVAAVATPIQMAVGDTLARWTFNNEPTKFAAIELVPETSSDVPETLLGRLNSDGDVEGGIAIPGLASWLSDPGDGTATVVQGLDADSRRRATHPREVNTVHLAWDVMVGLGTLLFLLSAWYWLTWIFRRDMPRSRLFLRFASVAGVAAVLAIEAGWTVTEVGRQPWIVHGHMKVEDAATTNEGVWVTFIVVAVLYLALATTLVLVLRSMSRRFRAQAEAADSDVPYGPRELPPPPPRNASASVDDAVAVVLFVVVTAYAVFGGADFGAGFWDLVAGGTERGARPRALIDHSIGPVWEANHVWLVFALVVLWTGFPEAFASITLTLFVPLTLVALGIVLRGSSFAFRKSLFRTSERRVFGAVFALSSVIVPYCMGAVAGAIASGRVPAGGKAGDPWSSWVNPTSIVGGLLAVASVAFLAAVYLVWDARRLEDGLMVEYFRRRADRRRGRRGRGGVRGDLRAAADSRYVFDGFTSRALPLVVLSAVCGVGSLVLLARRAAGALAWRPSAPWRPSSGVGAWPSGPTSCRRA